MNFERVIAAASISEEVTRVEVEGRKIHKLDLTSGHVALVSPLSGSISQPWLH